MGAVLSARDRNIRRTVAVKVMRNPQAASQQQLLRFIEEAQVTGQLEHPSIVPVYELGADADRSVFYSMKLVQGATLKEVLTGLRTRDEQTTANYPLNRLLNIFLKICEAMAFAHSRGVIHRDLKPENIMVGEYGEVLVMDWGLAKVLRTAERVASGNVRGSTCSRAPEPRGSPAGAASHTEESTADAQHAGSASPSDASIQSARKDSYTLWQTMDGQVMGTPAYMAPEQARGKVDELDARTDIYALGAILYSILALRPPVSGNTQKELLENVIRGNITPPVELTGQETTSGAPSLNRNEGSGESATPRRGRGGEALAFPHCPGGHVPGALSAVVMKALALDPAKRYQAASELRSEIEAYQSGFATSAEHAGLGRQLALLVRRHKTEFSLVAAALLVLLAVVTGFVSKVTVEKNRAARNKQTAVANEQLALKARDTAVSAQQAEKAQRERAETALRDLEYENYVNQIAVADARIRELAFDKAEELLWQTPPHLRHWEWGYLMKQCHQDLLTIRGDWGRVFSVRFSPDGKLLATGTEDGIARIWDARTGGLMRELVGHRQQINAVAFSPDGRRLLTGGGASSARIWSVETGSELASLKCNAGVRAVAFLPNGRRFVTADDGARVTSGIQRRVRQFGR